MTDKHLINMLKEYAQQFREAIIRTNGTLLPVTFNDFPQGSCGDSSWLLGRYLREKGIGDVEYVCGVKSICVNGDYVQQSHAWLEVSEVIIDITANQFNDVIEEVIVTADHSWHRRFGQEKRMIADYNAYDSPANRNLDIAFELICKNIRE